MSGTEKYVQPGVQVSQGYLRREIKARPDDEKAVVADGRCSICKTEVAPPGNFCVECGAVFVKEKIDKNKRGTQFLSSAGGRVEMKPPKSAGLGVEPDPAGRHDAGAVKVALKKNTGAPGSDFEYGETQDKAGVIDMTGFDWVPGKGYMKKKDKK